MTGVSDKRRASFDPRRKGLMHSQLPLAHVSLWYKLEELYHAGTEIGVNLQHLLLGPSCCPRRSWGGGKVCIGVRRGYVKDFVR
jgi:hypothetical protein